MLQNKREPRLGHLLQLPGALLPSAGFSTDHCFLQAQRSESCKRALVLKQEEKSLPVLKTHNKFEVSLVYFLFFRLKQHLCSKFSLLSLARCSFSWPRKARTTQVGQEREKNDTCSKTFPMTRVEDMFCNIQ